MHGPTIPARRSARRSAGALALALAVGAAAGCSGSDDAPGSDGTPGPAQPPLTTTAKAGELTGRLPQARRQAAVEGVSKVVDGWFDAAFTEPSYPHQGFADAFPGFTAGARRAAEQDVDQLTSAAMAEDITGLTATRRIVTVDLLATRGVARTATARIRFDYVTSGDEEVTRSVRGRLLLTHGEDGWTVFGYDVVQGRLKGTPRPSGSPSASTSPSASGSGS